MNCNVILRTEAGAGFPAFAGGSVFFPDRAEWLVRAIFLFFPIHLTIP